MTMPGVLFLHHFGGSARAWDAVIARLEGVETLAIDLPGFGSAAAAPGPFTVAAYADAAMAALQSMRSDSVIVVGHSMGGKAALAVAARQPERLVSLLLLSPSPPTPEPMSDADRAAALSGWGRLDFAEATLAKTVAGPLGSQARDLALDDMLRCSAEAWRDWLETGSRENIAPAMARIALPALVLCGAMDTTIAADTHRHDLLPLLHDAVLRIIPGAAHLLPIEAPVVVADAIAELIGLHAAEMRLPAASDESATLPLMRR